MANTLAVNGPSTASAERTTATEATSCRTEVRLNCARTSCGVTSNSRSLITREQNESNGRVAETTMSKMTNSSNGPGMQVMTGTTFRYER